MSTQTVGALPPSRVAQLALDLMRRRRVIGLEVKGRWLTAADVRESDGLALDVIKALRERA